MIRISQFTPSDDVLQAIRSLRADDDGLDRADRDTLEIGQPTTSESPGAAPTAARAKYDRPIVGQYLRARA